MSSSCIITVLYNSGEHLNTFLLSWFKWERETDIIFVDNNSGDDSVYALEKFVRDNDIVNIFLIKNSSNLGFGKANNLGIQRAINMGYDYVLLLNDDIEFVEKISSNLIKSYKQGRVLSPLQKVDLQNLEFNFNKFVGENLLISDDETVKVEFAQAASWFFSVNLKNFIGGYFFDEDFFHYGEDNEMIYRVNTRSDGIYILRSSSVLHHSSISNRVYPRDYGVYHLNRLKSQALISIKTNGSFHKSLNYRFIYNFIKYICLLNFRKSWNILDVLIEINFIRIRRKYENGRQWFS